jgi:hypothetical protein
VVKPDDIDDLLDEQRIGAERERVLQVRYGSNLAQIRPTVDLDRPLRWAIEARDQCVASAGVD